MDQEKSQRLFKYIKDGLINGIVIAIATAYIFFGMVTLQVNKVSIFANIVQLLISILCGIFIKQGLGENGFNKGYNSEVWSNELLKYNNACNTATDYMDRVENFYYCQEIEKRIAYRRNTIMAAKLRYGDFFDEFENFIGEDRMQLKRIRHSKFLHRFTERGKKGLPLYTPQEQEHNKKVLSRSQKRAVKKCIRVKIYTLNLFSEYSATAMSLTKRERTDKNQRFKMFGKNSFSQVLVAVLGVYFVPGLGSWDWGRFLGCTLQVILWTASGIMQLYTNYNYVVIDKVNKMKQKKEIIQKFVKGCGEGKYKTNPYVERENGKIYQFSADIAAANAIEGRKEQKATMVDAFQTMLGNAVEIAEGMNNNE